MYLTNSNIYFQFLCFYLIFIFSWYWWWCLYVDCRTSSRCLEWLVEISVRRGPGAVFSWGLAESLGVCILEGAEVGVEVVEVGVAAPRVGDRRVWVWGCTLLQLSESPLQQELPESSSPHSGSWGTREWWELWCRHLLFSSSERR